MKKYCFVFSHKDKIWTALYKNKIYFLTMNLYFTFFLYCHNTFLNEFGDFPLFSLTQLFQMSSKNSICKQNLIKVTILSKLYCCNTINFLRAQVYQPLVVH